MQFGLVILKEIYDFIYWWLIAIPLSILNGVKSILLEVDHALVLRENFRLWLVAEPMFGDYTWQGRLVGFFLRGLRVVCSVLVYLLIVLLGVLIIVGWFAVPIFLFKAFV